MEFINRASGKALKLIIETKHDTKGEHIYKFRLVFENGKTAFTNCLINTGRPYMKIPCYMSEEKAYTLSPDFYMDIEPNDLYKQETPEIKKIILSSVKETKIVIFEISYI